MHLKRMQLWIKNSDGICQYVVLEGEAGHQDSIVRAEYSVNTMVEKGVETEKLGYANRKLETELRHRRKQRLC